MLKLYKNYKYDSNYDIIKMFNSEIEQLNYFNSLEYEEIENDFYIRTSNNNFILEMTYEDIENGGYNYITYCNEDKIYYAFINDIQYNSQYRTNILFQLDVIQTYMFDFTLEKSFIERKKCNLSELTIFDEGIEQGEYYIESDTIMLTKNSNYFAMFNGLKEQSLTFDDKGNLTNVLNLPFVNGKPLTTIDGINYPLYFLPLKEEYKTPTKDYITVPGLGETNGGTLSAKCLRFIKGYEGLAQYPAYFNGESFRTAGYGITEIYQSFYYNLLGQPPISEKKATEILIQMMNNEYVSTLYQRMLRDGLTAEKIKQRHFDAFISLSMNGGIGAVTSSPMYAKYLINQNDETIYSDWLEWYIRNENGEIMQGLVDRRLQEATIFKDGVYNYRQIGIYSTMGTIIDVVTDNNGHGYIPNTVGGEV